ncbi:GAF and ANTAR domain-containing protein [Saccharothrix luteola]|uniref:GAF and ANTAR domain-containing protein n=1 Tax=Saccharothrix luteola TaxID=2893018 RepID=UPI001E613CA5|nr:GAF and ANTAR domain-containing protein [Saccharothrix luteola]MCC8247675.1 GAF and ANTAR domain-containing protein [Saccharothrix luteola]
MDGRPRGRVGDKITDVVIRRLDDVTGALAGLCAVLEQEEDLSAILDRVCNQVGHAIPGADMVSVTLLSDEGPVTGAMTRQDALQVDLAQYRAEEGPCLQAARTGQLVHAVADELPNRWPAFAEEVSGFAVAGFLSVPLCVDEEAPGSLNLYSERTDGFRALDVALLELYTTAAEAAMRNARRYFNAREQTAQLRQALTSRAVIDQAKGIVMAVHRVGADEAFTMLVERSQRENVKLRDFAERFVNDLLAAED